LECVDKAAAQQNDAVRVELDRVQDEPLQDQLLDERHAQAQAQQRQASQEFEQDLAGEAKLACELLAAAERRLSLLVAWQLERGLEHPNEQQHLGRQPAEPRCAGLARSALGNSCNARFLSAERCRDCAPSVCTKCTLQ
jgi:hypothetical protein